MTMETKKLVSEVEKIHLEGNVVPASWFQSVKTDTGKTALLAINLLADVMYWYRPTEIRDEATGSVLKKVKKFKADKLQRNYQQIAEQFGVSKDLAREACDLLVVRGLILREFRTITFGGMTLNNVMFLEPVPDKVKTITFRTSYPYTRKSPPYTRKSPPPIPENHPPLYPKIQGTYTETTTEITTKILQPSEIQEPKPNPPTTPDGIRDAEYRATFERLFKFRLEWSEVNKKGETVATRWTYILKRAKAEKHTAHMLEYAATKFDDDGPMSWCKAPSPKVIYDYWGVLMDGYDPNPSPVAESKYDWSHLSG